jgi:hypothetical protein
MSAHRGADYGYYSSPDDYPRPRNYRWSSYTVFEKMPLLQEQLQSVPGLNRLESFSLALGLLDWKIVILPCLKTLCLGNAAYVTLPLDKSILHECPRGSKAENLVKFLDRLPNLKHLELRSINGRGSTGNDCYRAQGHIYMSDLYTFLEAAPTIE